MSRLPFVLLLCLTLPLAACHGAASTQCHKGPDDVPMPDERKVLAAITNGQGGRDIAAAVFDGDVAKVSALAKRDPALLASHVPSVPYPDFQPDGQFGDLLTFAVARCDRAMVDALLSLGSSPDGGLPGSALEMTIAEGDVATAARLLDAGATPDPQKKRAGINQPLRLAGLNDRPEMAKLLLDHGADLHWRDSTGTTALLDIVSADSMLVAEVLVAAGADLWEIDPTGAMPVHKVADSLLLTSPKQEAARARLIARAKRPGLPWPPPKREAVLAGMQAGTFPSAAERAAGLRPPSAEVLAKMRADVALRKGMLDDRPDR